jgi:hypothetical protein
LRDITGLRGLTVDGMRSSYVNMFMTKIRLSKERGFK